MTAEMKFFVTSTVTSERFVAIRVIPRNLQAPPIQLERAQPP
jgi:hypothetical protein